MNKISDLKVGDQVVTMKGKIDTFVKIHRCCGAARLKNHYHVSSYLIDWQKTNELNNNKMNEILIEAPTGFEVYLEKKTIKFRAKTENKLPMSVEEIPNRMWYIESYGTVRYSENSKQKNQLSTKERSEAFLALMQLVELRDAWNGDWKADFTNDEIKYSIYVIDNCISKNVVQKVQSVLHFKSRKIAEKFAEQFKYLIETAKELL